MMFNHAEIKKALYQGQFESALELLNEKLKDDSTDLSLLCDRALCWHQLGYTVEFEQDLATALQIFEDSTPEIRTQEQLNHAVILAKFLEEKGQYSQARSLLKKSSGELTPKQFHALRIQQLRVAVECNDLNLARNLYNKITSGSNHSLDFEVEREHALLLADAALLGFSHAIERYQQALSHPLCQTDQDFLKSEIAEAAILSKNFSFLAELNMTLTQENLYEQAQALFIASYCAGNEIPVISIPKLEKSLNLMSLVRLLRQALLLFPNHPQRSSWMERYRLHVGALTEKFTQDMFLQPVLLQALPTQIEVNSSRRTLLAQSGEKAIKSKLFWMLLAAFREKGSSIQFEDAIQTIYQESTNEQHFDRLRIALLRLNRELEVHLNVKAVFQLGKNELSLLIPIKDLAEVNK